MTLAGSLKGEILQNGFYLFFFSEIFQTLESKVGKKNSSNIGDLVSSVKFREATGFVAVVKTVKPFPNSFINYEPNRPSKYRENVTHVL